MAPITIGTLGLHREWPVSMVGIGKCHTTTYGTEPGFIKAPPS